jgi:hypothetical protein
VKGTVNATNYVVYRAPRPQLISTAKAYAAGLSGAPASSLYVERFVVGTGASTFQIGFSLTHTAFGTSGIQSYSLAASGSSLLQLQAGDVVRVLAAGGTGAALTDLSVQLVVQNVADIKTWG